MIGQLYSTAENGEGLLPQRLHFHCLEGPRARIAAIAMIALDAAISIAVGRLFGRLVTRTDRAVTAGLYRVRTGSRSPTNSPCKEELGRPVGWADKLLRVAGSIIRLAQCTPNGNALVAAYPRLTFEGSAHDLDTMRELMQGQRRL